MIIKKRSIFKQAFSWKIQHLRKSGLIHQLSVSYLKKVPYCTPLVRKAEALSIQKLVSVFLILGIGVILSFGLFCLEKKLVVYKQRLFPMHLHVQHISRQMEVLIHALQNCPVEVKAIVDNTNSKQSLLALLQGRK